mmetsp:Transcript_8406/g.52580  ORF Transcript_8406/g.52580 Transcript_8406/m.52580 type:complete len:83 (+) Transcript_8406:1734-1982(+)
MRLRIHRRKKTTSKNHYRAAASKKTSYIPKVVRGGAQNQPRYHRSELLTKQAYRAYADESIQVEAVLPFHFARLARIGLYLA